MRRLTTLLLLLLALHVAADHLVGGDIQYRYIGDSTGVNNEYEIILRLYRDTKGIQLGTGPQNINICSSCFGYTTETLPLVEGGPGYISPTLFDCVNPNMQGTVMMEYYIYKKSVVLPGKCSDFTITYEACCRNADIDNIVAPSQNGFMLESKLNNTIGNNTSPLFLSEPVRAFCVGNEFYWQHFADDPDGDSIVYELVDVKSSIGVCSPNDLVYTPGYTKIQPISTSPPNSLIFDEQTGLMNFIPSTIETDVIALEVKEYRQSTSGVYEFIGSSYRDMQITVSPTCKNAVANGTFLDSNAVMFAPGSAIPTLNSSCHDTVIHLEFGVKINCHSITQSASEFILTGINGQNLQIKSAQFEPDIHNETDQLDLILQNPLNYNGSYSLKIVLGSDGNTLINKCGFDVPQNSEIYVNVSDCKTLDFQITNIDVVNDKFVDVIWDLDLEAFDTSSFNEFRLYRKESNSTSWQYLYSTDNIYERHFRDKSLTSSQLDAKKYHYRLALIYNGFVMSWTQVKNPILLKGTSDYCDKMPLEWSSYRKRYNGYIVEIGNDFSGNIIWKPIYDPSGQYTTLDTSYYCELPNSETKGYFFRVKSISDADNSLVSRSNVIDCICKNEIEVEEDRVFVPNVFTPNGDGRNDAFTIGGLEQFSRNEIAVFNRWGNLVFTKEDYSNNDAWTGRDMDGNLLSEGVYMYQIHLYENNDIPLTINGSVTILDPLP